MYNGYDIFPEKMQIFFNRGVNVAPAPKAISNGK